MEDKLEQVLLLLNEIREEYGGAQATAYILPSGTASAYLANADGHFAGYVNKKYQEM